MAGVRADLERSQLLRSHHDPSGIPMLHLLQRVVRRRQPLQRGDALRSGARLASPGAVAPIAAKHDLVLMSRQEIAGVVFVSKQRVKPGAGRGFGKDVFVIGEQAVSDSAGRDVCAWPMNFALGYFSTILWNSSIPMLKAP